MAALVSKTAGAAFFIVTIALSACVEHVHAVRSLLQSNGGLLTCVAPNCNPTGQIILCGPGTARARCPTTACSNSFSSSVSGPGGCSQSVSQISAIGYGATYWQPLQAQFQTQVQSMCNGASNLQYNGQPAYLSFVQAVSNTIAQTTASTLIQYAQYVCSCSGTNNQATSQVAANVQSVADVIAKALATAISSVTGDVGNGCGPYEDFITYANATATAVSQTIVLATNSYFNNIGYTGSGCISTGVQNKFSTQIATAVACTIADAYGLVYTDPNYPASAGACSRSASYSGLGAAGGTAVCPVTPVCPCSSATNLVKNPGFETGDFTGWTHTGNTGATGVTTGRPHSGAFAARLGPVGSDGYLTQTFSNLDPSNNVYYQFSFWLAADGGSHNDFSLRLLDSNSNEIPVVQAYGPYGPGPAPGLPFTDTNGFAYNQYVFTFSPLDTSATIGFQFAFRQDPAFFYLDDVSLMCSQYA